MDEEYDVIVLGTGLTVRKSEPRSRPNFCVLILGGPQGPESSICPSPEVKSLLHPPPHPTPPPCLLMSLKIYVCDNKRALKVSLKAAVGLLRVR